MTNLFAVSVLLSVGVHHQATLYIDQQRYAEAAVLCRTTLQSVEAGTLEAGLLLRDLARAYRGEGQYNRAIAAQRQQIEIVRTQLGEEDANIAVEVDRLGEMIFEQGRYSEAARIFAQALLVAENSLDPRDPHLALILNDMAAAEHRNGHDREARKLFHRSLEINDSAVTRLNLQQLEPLTSTAAKP
jgi:tetratricopeptide (TPR) repeat protein